MSPDGTDAFVNLFEAIMGAQNGQRPRGCGLLRRAPDRDAGSLVAWCCDRCDALALVPRGALDNGAYHECRVQAR